MIFVKNILHLFEQENKTTYVPIKSTVLLTFFYFKVVVYGDLERSEELMGQLLYILMVVTKFTICDV